MKQFYKASMTAFLLSLSSTVSFAAHEPVPPFGYQTADGAAMATSNN